MVYQVAMKRKVDKLPVYGLWNGDADTADGQERINYRRPYEAKEIFKFNKQPKG